MEAIFKYIAQFAPIGKKVKVLASDGFFYRATITEIIDSGRFIRVAYTDHVTHSADLEESFCQYDDTKNPHINEKNLLLETFLVFNPEIFQKILEQYRQPLTPEIMTLVDIILRFSKNIIGHTKLLNGLRIKRKTLRFFTALAATGNGKGSNNSSSQYMMMMELNKSDDAKLREQSFTRTFEWVASQLNYTYYD